VMVNDSLQCAIPSQIGCSAEDITLCSHDKDSMVLTEDDRRQMEAKSAVLASNNPFVALKEQLEAAKKVKKS
jgi:hypothetical protein